MIWQLLVPLIVSVLPLALGSVYSEDGRKFKCPMDPLTDRYPDPTDPTCRRFFLCHLGHAHAWECDVRRAFHPQLKQCYPRYQIPDSICAHPVDCDKNGYMADPEDCTKYYICFFHQAVHYGCLVDHVFDPKNNQCVKDKKKAKSCEKPRPRKTPNPQHHSFQRDRYPVGGGSVRKGPNPEEPTYFDSNSGSLPPNEPAGAGDSGYKLDNDKLDNNNNNGFNVTTIGQGAATDDGFVGGDE